MGCLDAQEVSRLGAGAAPFGFKGAGFDFPFERYTPQLSIYIS